MGLTDTEVKAAKAKEKPYKLYDQDGLLLLVKPGGSKLWRWKYHFDNKEKALALGKYPIVTLKEARDAQLKAQKLLFGGIDPGAQRKAEAEDIKQQAEAELSKAENSFESVARRWWDWWSVGKAPRHAGYVMRRFEADVFPAFGHKNIDAVTPTDVRELMLAIEGRNASDVAKRAHQNTGQVFRYAVANGLATRNPATDFRPGDVLKAVETENFARVEEEELPELLVKMEDYNGSAITVLALKLMKYTFVRTMELRATPWTEIDLESAMWDIRKGRMKKVKRESLPHLVPLSRQAVSVLQALKLLTGNGRLVFPGAKDKDTPMSENTILYALYEMGYKGRMTGHGFRGVASTILNDNNFVEAHVEMQLAHLKRDKVAGAYNKAKYLEQRKVMMQWWADYLDEQLAKGRSRQLKRDDK